MDSVEKKQSPAQEDNEEDVEETLEEDVTRCICGRPEYPGPGASVKEQLSGSGKLVENDTNEWLR